MSILELQNVEKIYGERENQVNALKDISLQVEEGEFAAIVGTSGSGKSTLLNLIGGLDNPTKGEIFVKNREIGSLSRKELTIFRRRNIGFVFQNYNLVPILNVYQNIVLPIELDGNKVDKAYVNKIIQMLHLEEKLDHLPNNLSGGQQQRAAIARALAGKPAIILADEPTGNLDTQNSREVIALLKEASQKYEQTIIMITHSRGIAQTADRILQVSDGELTDFGRCRE